MNEDTQVTEHSSFIGRQTVDKEERSSYLTIKNISKFNSLLFLAGNEKKIFDYLQTRVIKNTQYTMPLTKEDIILNVGIKSSCLKKTLDRLEIKNVIKIASSKTGRFGWRIFHII